MLAHSTDFYLFKNLENKNRTLSFSTPFFFLIKFPTHFQSSSPCTKKPIKIKQTSVVAPMVWPCLKPAANPESTITTTNNTSFHRRKDVRTFCVYKGPRGDNRSARGTTADYRSPRRLRALRRCRPSLYTYPLARRFENRSALARSRSYLRILSAAIFFFSLINNVC